MKRREATATWTGGLKDGEGRLTSASKVLDGTGYSFHTRFEDGEGTNPEELIAAAHAGCYSMALSKVLNEAGMTPRRIDTTATVSLEQVEGGFAITKVHLDVEVDAEGGDDEAFREATEGAKNGCPVSKVLNAEITLKARRSG